MNWKCVIYFSYMLLVAHKFERQTKLEGKTVLIILTTAKNHHRALNQNVNFMHTKRNTTVQNTAEVKSSSEQERREMLYFFVWHTNGQSE